MKSGPGILAWLVAGCLAWQAEGLKPPASITGATEEYQQEQDTLAHFIDECCLIQPEATVRGRPLYAAYQQWATECGLRPMSKVAFGKRMKKRFNSIKSNGVLYQGLRLRVEPPTEQPELALE